MASLISVDIKASGDEKQRYKMPTILTKTESGGNGVKTVFANIEDVAAAIFREAEVLHKYFGYELGAQATFVSKENKYLVMGEFPADILQKKVFEFIEKFVLCSKCRCPETDVEAGPKGRSVILRCRACGTGHTAQANEKMTPLLLKYANKTTETKKVRAHEATTSSAAAAYIGERPDIVFPSLSDEIKKQQVKLLEDVHSVITNPTLPRDQIAQELVNIRKKAQFSEADLPRMIIRGALCGASSGDIIQCLRVAAPQLQLLTARQDADGTATAATTKTPAYAVILEEVIYISLKAEVKLAPFRIPMLLRMFVEESVLEPQYVKEFHDANTNPNRPKYFEKTQARMIKYGFPPKDFEDLITGMTALKNWMGWEDDKVEGAEVEAEAPAEDKKEKKDKSDKKEKKDKSDKKEKADKMEKKSAKVDI
jgi:translation initiation factor 2 beta subunit (eIF-2beta)/eIF-5